MTTPERNWSGTYTYSAQQIDRPQTISELQRLITTAGQRSLLGRWHFLGPDLARILRTFAGPIHRHLMDNYVDHHRPAWYVAWNVELLWRNEAPFSFPDMSADVFAARALILNEPADQLARHLDVPWCKGDEYYVQKLAILCARAAE